ncbi:hypothetical protein A2715_01490 [Candidatus Woesebacteria bacterium RIFCSPHIGHO2_01_FULL_39_32]|uniref:Succinyl-diaminopimelate desuccinylase n=2 Tax=Candidatus Woeseibacteriota TaxID=1752722 RepID=A0A0G0S7G3_9BACT|nr:MAG: Succinyl-diaminopimelate desuccinylase [Candidatus Woesebacteria bacterium GW2011_GWA1_39_8]OGM04203.1 MAG: hypothetical protein A2124_02020 [Candidatus Woesebacteria bacterium GWB1_37_5]OGM23835.1 MAG: hypothetical protein A2715_01490 [Candidatus Woesebacteria bacterium RIFCSPHIGHO2_01_FULL_39_32]OGM35718.1 MAG: hypothetical protein A3F01_02220 [Candidatus Woesebacteria bacterium RIFCSPHIGHO2_12_FULL_38_11]OGM64023.1 MAG: hypothetical protein A2893_02730 [Candidatus Woesebacteria bacte
MINKILCLSKKLIEIPSNKENPNALREVLRVCEKELKVLQSKKFKKKEVPSLLYYNTPKIPKRFKIILNAHLDVVPAKDKQYKPKIVGDKLYGRGANDMKAAAAVMIFVYKELSKKVKYPLGLQLVADEETGGFNGTKYQIGKGVRADFVIAGEPTDLGVNNKAKGIVWIKVKAKGKSAHGAYIWQGENAIYMVTEFLNKLKEKYPVPKKEIWKTTMNVAKVVTSNETFNKVPDDCEAWLDIRYIPEDSDTITQRIKSLVPKGVELEIILKEPAQLTYENNPFVKKLRESTKEITGKLAPVIVKHGASDIRHHNQIGCDGVTFGPIGKGLHTDNEWVSVKSLSDYYEILKDFLLSF